MNPLLGNLIGLVIFFVCIWAPVTYAMILWDRKER